MYKNYISILNTKYFSYYNIMQQTIANIEALKLLLIIVIIELYIYDIIL